MRTFFFAFLSLCGFSLSAQKDSLRGPHNGAVAIIGEYRLEATGCDEYLEVYVYDKYMEPMLNFGISGEVLFFKNDNASTGSKLVMYGNDGFTAKFPEYYFPYYKVSVKIQSVTYTAKFRNECLIPN